MGLVLDITSKPSVISPAGASAIEAEPGITVNVIPPGLIETAGITANEGVGAKIELVKAKQIVKRRGNPLDLAHAFCSIASLEAPCTTGQIFDAARGGTFH